MGPEQLATVTRGGDARVWRIGFRPDPWAWSGWEWATDGRFPGRWDDLHGNFRTVYAGSSLQACLLEVLASFRRDARLAMELDEIVEDDEDAVLHPTVPSGQVPREWLDARAATSAELTGTYCAVTDSRSIAALYPHFIGTALSLGLTDFDAAALKDARPRQLTQAIAAWIYETTDIDGVTFASRHGDDLRLWAIFERPGDGSLSPRLRHTRAEELHHDSNAIKDAFQMLGLTWKNE
ncbi:RES family NAD+ phosphorylase [Arthrobacter sp. I2-34]|uniref:RES family NAD+ phosphorylase n=1 Tax=Arthrobacter hankyongi TaxID=2904801 RepID=A0ABS9LE10_9MICC|nr:RES domain-containing protein [Arthrobacter hankyongi]MCG2624801.1 RES family NAD+ phosphorylase [Arthrobacter hankyongi]